MGQTEKVSRNDVPYLYTLTSGPGNGLLAVLFSALSNAQSSGPNPTLECQPIPNGPPLIKSFLPQDKRKIKWFKKKHFWRLTWQEQRVGTFQPVFNARSKCSICKYVPMHQYLGMMRTLMNFKLPWFFCMITVFFTLQGLIYTFVQISPLNQRIKIHQCFAWYAVVHT